MLEVLAQRILTNQSGVIQLLLSVTLWFLLIKNQLFGLLDIACIISLIALHHRQGSGPSYTHNYFFFEYPTLFVSMLSQEFQKTLILRS